MFCAVVRYVRSMLIEIVVQGVLSLFSVCLLFPSSGFAGRVFSDKIENKRRQDSRRPVQPSQSLLLWKFLRPPDRTHSLTFPSSYEASPLDTSLLPVGAYTLPAVAQVTGTDYEVQAAGNGQCRGQRSERGIGEGEGIKTMLHFTLRNREKSKFIPKQAM